MQNAGEVNGKGTLVFPGTDGGHDDVRHGRNHHKRGEAVQKHRHEEVA